ncbi:hypothetical protein BC792_10510 [Sphingobacterium allocomposti]|uniref:Uncharacterized protein n=1 Tax=Sphingobacterium allocomposti TaxID=415956 RepID=A0A5S5DKQ0_9SPHI|nr:hypothetical protein [Sphingobacterium composti Yoo et al. 2007 non Ten et al. 2007]TYP96523.1 hypothetical protein BC792_10510 [Sphingobacterium composti Yoo et al. 2007 non Ten et al. 2007]
MNKAILSPDVQAFIYANRDKDVAAIALAKSPFDNVQSRELAAQVDGLQRIKKKVAEWHNVPGLYFPDKLNLEQASSMATGGFKASLIKHGSRLIDLTGGFGVDSFYFAQRALEVTHCEINEHLSAIVAHNFDVLRLFNITCFSGDGVQKIRQSSQTYDYIYIDPSRRVNQKKVFRLEDCVPDIIALQDLFFERATCIITKLAPLLDIHLALKQLEHVRDVYVVSVDNDCKELLFIQQKAYDGETTIHAVRLQPDGPQDLSFTNTEEKEHEVPLSPPRTFLYDPDVAINKAGAFKTVGIRYGLHKLGLHTHLYTSDELVPSFPGKCFKIVAVHPLRALKKEMLLKKANVVSKNFPLRVDDLRKKFGIRDGGDDFLYFCTLHDGEHVAIHGIRQIS